MNRFTILALISLLLIACATSPTGRRQLMLVSEDTAISASKEAYAQTLKPLSEEGKVDNDPVLKKRVTEITERLVAQAVKMRPATARWEWSIKVIDDPDVVTPSGQGANVFKDRGSLDRADFVGPSAVVVHRLDIN